MKKISVIKLCLIVILFGYSSHTMCLESVEYQSNQELFSDKTILILGGTGYLGSAIATEVLKYNPKKIIIFSRDEVKHFYIAQRFSDYPNLQTVIGDIRDYDALLTAMKDIDIVFHCAALKRMDLIESNVEEAVKTNILSSINVFKAAVTNNVKKVLFVSTDKACLPINAYGACKFVSEKIFTNYNPKKISTQFIVTRFGNILESTGSVIPIFIDKIKKEEIIPLTDEKMTRFIIDKEGAAELIFDALRYGIGGEIFVKKLPAMRIVDLIEVLKEKFQVNTNIKMIGLRPGEKIHEVLINESEMARAIQFNDYYIIRPSILDKPSSIEEQKSPLYIGEGTAINWHKEGDYSSAFSVLSKDSLGVLLKNLKLL